MKAIVIGLIALVSIPNSPVVAEQKSDRHVYKSWPTKQAEPASSFQSERIAMNNSAQKLNLPAGSAASLAIGKITTPPLDNPPGFDYATSKIEPWTGKCEHPITTFPNWEGYPVARCKYSDIGATVHTYMLNPDRSKIAKWFGNACHDAAVTDTGKCIDYLVAETRVASSMGVFPVAGYIPEPQDGGLCFLFRDGVVIKTATHPRQIKPVSGTCGPDTENSQPITQARVYARISSTTRGDYIAAGGTEPVGADPDPRWATVIRKLYQEAWNSPRNKLISAKAINAKREKLIH